MEPYKKTEGEEYIAEYLSDYAYDFKEQVKILNLKGDSRSHRVADFYLPEYKIYIEFFGMWANPVNRQKYNEKKLIYKNNNVCCIYFYPDNLGFFPWIFKRRLREELIKKNKIREFIRHEFKDTNALLYIMALAILPFISDISSTLKIVLMFIITYFFVMKIHSTYKLYKRIKTDLDKKLNNNN